MTEPRFAHALASTERMLQRSTDAEWDGPLDDAAVDTLGRHVVRLIEEPHSFPSIDERSQIL